MLENKKIAVVTGGSSGIGLQTALILSNNNYKVYDLSRHGKTSENIIHITTDVTDSESIKNAFEQIENNIDILVTCAGFGISGAAVYTNMEAAKKQLDVNLFGTAETINQAFPKLNKNVAKIICVSSVAAVVPIPFQAWYSVSKSGINALVMSLANELKTFGIQICAVMPGDVKTAFTQNREKQTALGNDYTCLIERSVNKMEVDEQKGMSPKTIAEFIYKLTTYKNIKPLYTIGFSYKCITILMKILPCRTANYIIGKLYAK